MTGLLADALCIAAVASGLLAAGAALSSDGRRWRAFTAAALASLTAECAVERAWINVAVTGVLLAGLAGWAAWKRRQG